MLSLSSINNQSPGTPLVPMSRPALTQEAVRSASPLAEIQPATAISRERSRTEAKPKDPAAVGELAQQTQAEQMAAAERVAAQRAAARTALPALEGSAPVEQPPSDKNPIQKALDTQIKDVLNTVWKASGKAVDFLLGRRETLMDATLKEVLLPGEVDYLGVSPQVNRSAVKNPASGADVVQYTAQGGSGALGDGRGQILDMVV